MTEWKALEDGYRKDDDKVFCSQIEKLYNKAVSKLQPSKIHKGILVTTMSIGTIVGVSYDWIGTAIISSCQISNHRETFATVVFHELGHMHGAPSCHERKKLDRRVNNDSQIVALEKEQRETNAIYECLGEHCLNIGCSMRQRLCFANWRLHLTKERLQVGRPYCDRCTADLKGFFKNSAEG